MELSLEEKKAIEILKKLQKKTPYIIWEDGTPYNKSNQIQTILNLIEKQQKVIEQQQKEINFYKNEELGYIAGYEDGKRHKQTAVMIKKENAQQELFEKEIVRLKKIIENQQKEIKKEKSRIMELDELLDKQQKEIEDLKEKNTQLTNYLNDSYYVSADEIREIITEYQKQLQSADTERTAIMLSNFIMVLNDLLEEN